LSSTYVTELATQIFVSIQNTIKIISEFIGFKKEWENNFSKILDLTAEDIKKGYMVFYPDPNNLEMEGRLYVQDLVNNCLESITSADENLRREFENHLIDFMDWTEKGRKKEVLAEKRRQLRRRWIISLGNDRAKYDARLMKQMDLIVQMAEGVGFKARTDLREEFRNRQEGMEDED